MPLRVSREVFERDVLEVDRPPKSVRQRTLGLGDRLLEPVDRRDAGGLVRVAPRQPTVAAADLQHLGVGEVRQIEQ